MIRRSIALAALALLFGCNPQAPKSDIPTPTPSASMSLPSLKITGRGTAKQPIRIIQQKGNRIQYQLTARSFQSSGAAASAKATFATPHVTFYGKDGSKLVADAPRALLDRSANTVVLSRGVVAHNNNGTTLQCDTLTYDQRTEMIHGAGHVVITDRSGFRATGSRLDTDTSLTHTQMQ